MGISAHRRHPILLFAACNSRSAVSTVPSCSAGRLQLTMPADEPSSRQCSVLFGRAPHLTNTAQVLQWCKMSCFNFTFTFGGLTKPGRAQQQSVAKKIPDSKHRLLPINPQTKKLDYIRFPIARRDSETRNDKGNPTSPHIPYCF